MNIGIIIARKGSQRLKNKNLRYLNKKPLYSWSIRILKKSKLFKKIIISTDHSTILRDSKKYCVDIALKRKKKLANSTATTIEVIKDIIKELIKKKLKFNYVCCMYPTSPLTTKKDLLNSFKVSKLHKNKFVFPAYSYRSNLNEKRKYEEFYRIKKIKKKKSLLINNDYVDAGQFYFSSKKNWLNKKKIIDVNNFMLLKKNTNLRDINTLNDLKFVRKIFNKKNEIL